MNYLCNCDPCICAADGADRTTSSSGQGMHRPPGSLVSKDGAPVRRSQNTGGSARRRAAPCEQAGVALEPPIGAHLITTRRGYTHHGIYAGHGSVVHYAGLARDFRPGPVEEVPLERFANGRPIHIECRSTPALNDRDIVSRARSRLGENRYRLLTNNCEHFSEWSRFGISRSPQVERWLGSALLVTRTLVANIGRGLARFRSEGRMGALA
ncbi:MAG TPA: lecithin retinol acyltransferase family protein [Steroidobacteraceae bacterium]|nr:lecithin retinol acyltransferase family protein [Steroidobacteraceae bacterium]